MKRVLFTVAVAAPMMLSAPAAAATWAFGGTAGNFASVSSTVVGEATLTAVARRYTLLPTAITNVSSLLVTSSGGADLTVSRTVPGIGVTGGASAPQIDTNNNNQREAILLTATRPIRLSGLKLSYIDRNDTLQVYGVKADGSTVSLGFGGDINTGVGGAASYVNTSANDGTTTLTFLNTLLPAFDRYIFTTRELGSVTYGGDLGQGYRIDAVSGVAVPEPASWMMMIVGFGLVGAMLRRRQPVTA
jgi:flagellar capping protein FliD